MRVISGVAKGRGLVSPSGETTRPTADRVKESLFNIINSDLGEATFLDLFAGTGGIGIEALSRGARKCVFVENGKEAYTALTENLARTKLSESAETYFADVEAAIKILTKKDERFDVIFMDPPYGETGQFGRLTDILAPILGKTGYIIGEHSPETDITTFRNIKLLRQKNYGKTTVISFWRPIIGDTE